MSDATLTIPTIRRSVGALFDTTSEARHAIDALNKQGFPRRNITLHRLTRRDTAILPKATLPAAAGKTLVTVNQLHPADCGLAIRLLHENGSQYNPDGSRHIRDDVVGMTTGAILGAAFGAILAGPVGAVLGGISGGIAGSALGNELEETV